jgi:hypothetical protein
VREKEVVEKNGVWGVTFTDIGKETRYITELYVDTNLKISFKTSNTTGKILASRNTNNKDNTLKFLPTVIPTTKTSMSKS